MEYHIELGILYILILAVFSGTTVAPAPIRTCPEDKKEYYGDCTEFSTNQTEQNEACNDSCIEMDGANFGTCEWNDDLGERACMCCYL